MKGTFNMNKRSELIKSLKRKECQPKRMKKTGPTIFITDDAKENTSLIKMREPKRKNKKSRGVFVKVIKKNQIIMFASALCLIGVGYLSYKPLPETNFVSTTLDNSVLADIGDATFVSSQKIIEKIEEVKENSIANEIIETIDNTNTIETNTILKNEQNDYFINSKIDRDKMYSQMLEIYQKMLDNPSIANDQKAIATQEITKINNQKNGIMIAENLIKTKGFNDVVIFINLDSINVVVKADILEKEQIAQIQNIVTRELEVEISNIHISTR